jgi:hypothetical protein
MRHIAKLSIAVGLCSALAMAVTPHAGAQAYPGKPVRIITRFRRADPWIRWQERSPNT